MSLLNKKPNDADKAEAFDSPDSPKTSADADALVSEQDEFLLDDDALASVSGGTSAALVVGFKYGAKLGSDNPTIGGLSVRK